MADSYPDEPNFLLKFKSAKTFEGCPSDFRLRIREFVKGLRPGVGLKIGKPHLDGYGSAPIVFLLHAGNNILNEFYEVSCDQLPIVYIRLKGGLPAD